MSGCRLGNCWTSDSLITHLIDTKLANLHEISAKNSPQQAILNASNSLFLTHLVARDATCSLERRSSFLSDNSNYTTLSSSGTAPQSNSGPFFLSGTYGKLWLWLIPYPQKGCINTFSPQNRVSSSYSNFNLYFHTWFTYRHSNRNFQISLRRRTNWP